MTDKQYEALLNKVAKSMYGKKYEDLTYLQKDDVQDRIERVY